VQLAWQALNTVVIVSSLVIACALFIFGFLTLFWREQATKWARKWIALSRMGAAARPGFLDQVVAPSRATGILYVLVGVWGFYCSPCDSLDTMSVESSS
jgi:hypothetical protein